MRRLAVVVLLATLLCAAGCSRATTPPSANSGVINTAATEATPTPPPAPVTFAVIGDYGMGDRNEAAVAKLVASWDPDFIVTTGDDYYNVAGGRGVGKYANSTGAYYGRWLKDTAVPPKVRAGEEATRNAFFPALGNHDYSDATPALDTYLTYFTLPGAGFTNTSGNERYYDFTHGPVRFFVLNSNPEEPDDYGPLSQQAVWLRAQMRTSKAPFNVVLLHHPPFSSDNVHASIPSAKWPFALWGADAVISGHAHTYERILQDGIVFFVNGLGGAKRYGFVEPVPGSAARYSADWGAQKVTASSKEMVFSFYNTKGELVDEYRIEAREP